MKTAETTLTTYDVIHAILKAGRPIKGDYALFGIYENNAWQLTRLTWEESLKYPACIWYERLINPYLLNGITLSKQQLEELTKQNLNHVRNIIAGKFLFFRGFMLELQEQASTNIFAYNELAQASQPIDSRDIPYLLPDSVCYHIGNILKNN